MELTLEQIIEFSDRDGFATVAGRARSATCLTPDDPIAPLNAILGIDGVVGRPLSELVDGQGGTAQIEALDEITRPPSGRPRIGVATGLGPGHTRRRGAPARGQRDGGRRLPAVHHARRPARTVRRPPTAGRARGDSNEIRAAVLVDGVVRELTVEDHACVGGPTVPACRCGRSHASTGSSPPTPSPDPGGLRHLGPVPALDGYRGLAVLLVLVVHTQEITLPRRDGDRTPRRVHPCGLPRRRPVLRAQRLPDHRVAVERAGPDQARRVRRLLRPPRVASAAGALLLPARAPGVRPRERHGSRPGVHFAVGRVCSTSRTGRSPLAPETTVHHFSHLWSLAVEEQFYLVWPFVVVGFLGPRQSARNGRCGSSSR